jgi:hypothetical protein
MCKGTVETEQPFFESGMQPNTFRSILPSVDAREPFFGFMSGMSTHGVDKIFKPKQVYPLLLQDYSYTIVDKQSSPQFFTGGQSMVLDNAGVVIPTAYVRIHDISDTTLFVRGRRNADQVNKRLDSIDLYYPLIFEYTSITTPDAPNANNLTCTVPIVTEYGIPEFLFVYAERQLPDSIPYRPDTYPTIVGLDVRFAYTNNKLGKYLGNELELWKAVRKNHHKLKFTKELKDKEGAVLLNATDIGFWGMNRMDKSDIFELNVNVIVKPNPKAQNEADATRDIRYGSPMKVTVALIYEDRMFISGTADRISFQKIK